VRRWGVRRTGFFAACVAALFALWTLRAPLERCGLATLVDIVTGGRAAFDAVSLGRSEATLSGVRFAFDGVTVFAAQRVRVGYRLRDFLPGGARRYGLERVSLEAPDVVLLRRANGSFAWPGGGAGASAADRGPGAPAQSAPALRFAATVHDGRITLIDPGRILPASRRFSLASLEGSALFDSAAVTHYRARAAYDGNAAYTLTVAGRIDVQRRFAQHRLHAAALPLAALVNYFINTPSAAFAQAAVRGLDLRAYAFGAPGVAPYHVAGSAMLEQGAMRVPGLVAEATGMRGRIDLFDDGIAAPALVARLGPVQVRLGGGLYQWSAPQFRLGLTSRSELGRVRSLFRFTRDLPLHGAVRLATFLEGPVGMPLVATRALAARLRYGAFPISNGNGRAIYYAQAVDVVGARGRYGGFDVTVNGSIDLGDLALTQLVLGASGTTSLVPYLAQAMPAGAADAQALLRGIGQRFEIRGALAGRGGATRTAGLFHIDPAGDGTFGPFDFRRDDGASLAGSFYLQRDASRSGFWLDARDYPLAEYTTAPQLPGLALVAPAFHGRLTGALAGEGPPSRFSVAGHAAGRDVRIGSVALASVSGDLAGAPGALRFAHVVGRGPWGRFDGRGAYGGQRLALEGRYRGDFARLRTFTGDLGADGPLAGPVALLVAPQRTLVQTRGAVTAGSLVHGLPLDGLAGTLDVRPGSLRLYGVTAALAGGTAVAAGDLGASKRLAFSLAGVDGSGGFKVAGLAPGIVTAIGTLGLRARSTEFDGGVTVRSARFDGVPLTGNGDVVFGKDRLEIVAADAIAGPAVGSFSGRIRNPGTPAVSYDVGFRVPATRLAPLARAVAPRIPYLFGTLATSAHLRGSGPRWTLAGRLDVPEGSVNGLGFEALSTDVGVDPGGLSVRAGSVTVGATLARFAAGMRGPDASLRLDAPRADLADFDDYFDAGDTLAGHGRIEARFSGHRALVAASADVAIAGLRYRRFDLGDATARVVSNGSQVRGRLGFGGPSGALTTSGTLILARAPLPQLLGRSRFEGTARLAGLDLGVWLPALGYQVPLAGRVDADATIRGRLGNPEVRTTASLGRGSIGPLPVDRLVISASSTLRRTTIAHAELQVPALDAQLSGSFGFGARDPLALAVHAKSSNIGMLAGRLTLGDFGATGTGEADVKIDGTRALPRVAGGFDVERAVVHGVTVPQALGQFSLRGRDVVLSGVEVNFATGTLALAGSVPLEISPFGFGSPQAAMALEAAATNIDLRNFAPLLPPGSVIAGRIDGRVGIGGTAGAPRLSGGLSLAAGSLRTPAETIPLDHLEARVGFSGHRIALQHLRLQAGGGTLTASGFAEVPDLVHPREDATYDFEARGQHVMLNFPAYGGGRMDGTLGLAQTAGSPPLVRGNLTLSDATIPFATLLGASGGIGGESTGAARPNAVLDLALIADRNVRVRSANVDIGARGSVHVGGTLSAPVLAGAFTSTGGTLSYFNTVFRLVDGTVTFEPGLGVIPTLDARAITHVINPDPNTVRNAAGTADITLALTGPVNALSITLESSPAYGREQILGLLLNAPAFGATNLFGETAQNPTYFGSANTASLSPSVVTGRNASGELSVAQEAFGVANAEFTRTLLAPFETTFAGALGLSNFNLNVDYTGNVGLSARKVLGKDVNAIYDTSFGYPYRQTFGFEVKPNEFEAAQVTVFQTLGAYNLDSLTPNGYLSTLNSKVRAAQPTSGSVGFSLSIQRLFP